MPATNTVPFNLPGFEVEQAEIYNDVLRIEAHSGARLAYCPGCGQSSSSIHSYYTRSPRDLPCSEYRVRLALRVRRFRCFNDSCPRKIFAERLEVVPPHGQRTMRLTTVLRTVVFEVAAETGTRLAHSLKMPISADTLLRVARQTPMGTIVPTPRVLGIDDWAFKKGRRYGTILVDLEQHRPIDLLPDRTAETLSTWLKAHPGIEIITRDRLADYIGGITAGAPQAIQIADRWHLLRNLSDALQRLLEHHTSLLRTVARQFQSPPSSEPVDEVQLPTKSNLRFREVKELATQGYSQRDIALSLKMSRNTVKRYLAAEAPPTYQGRGLRSSTITPYISYLAQRWAEGCHNSRILWEEIQRQGYPGSYGSVRVFVKRYRSPRPRLSVLPPPRLWTRRQVAWLLVLDPTELAAEDEAYLEKLCQASVDIAVTYKLAQQFVSMIRYRQGEALDPWLTDARSSSVSQLKNFAEGLLKDYTAIRSALEYEWSNGQVEGQVHRLKVWKRMMYGRANFDLLRLRVLHPP